MDGIQQDPFHLSEILKESKLNSQKNTSVQWNQKIQTPQNECRTSRFKFSMRFQLQWFWKQWWWCSIADDQKLPLYFTYNSPQSFLWRFFEHTFFMNYQVFFTSSSVGIKNIDAFNWQKDGSPNKKTQYLPLQWMEKKGSKAHYNEVLQNDGSIQFNWKGKSWNFSGSNLYGLF